MREQQQETKSVMQDGKNLVTQAWEVERLQEIIHYVLQGKFCSISMPNKPHTILFFWMAENHYLVLIRRHILNYYEFGFVINFSLHLLQ